MSQTRIDVCPDCGVTVVTEGDDTLYHTCTDDSCPWCGSSEWVRLGVLGNILHLRCRDCGSGTSIPYDESEHDHDPA